MKEENILFVSLIAAHTGKLSVFLFFLFNNLYVHAQKEKGGPDLQALSSCKFFRISFDILKQSASKNTG